MVTPPTPQDYVISALEKAGWVCETQALDPKQFSAYDECIGSGGYCGRHWPETVILRRGHGVIIVTPNEVFIDESACAPFPTAVHDAIRAPHARSAQMTTRAAQQLLSITTPR